VCDDRLTEGRVHDHFRCDYINEHLAACKQAIDEGVTPEATPPGPCWTTFNGPGGIHGASASSM